MFLTARHLQLMVNTINQSLSERKNMCFKTELRTPRGAIRVNSWSDNKGVNLFIGPHFIVGLPTGQINDVIQALTTYRDNLPKPCVHAELIKQYAEDCQKYEKPWELWECYWSASSEWKGISSHPSWGASIDYRRKGETS
jgi:hypothetical protein